MLGFLFNERECRELDYVLRKELDEMLFDLNDKRIDQEIKGSHRIQIQSDLQDVCSLSDTKGNIEICKKP